VAERLGSCGEERKGGEGGRSGLISTTPSNQKGRKKCLHCGNEVGGNQKRYQKNTEFLSGGGD